MNMSNGAIAAPPAGDDAQPSRSRPALPDVATEARRRYAEILAVQEEALGPEHPQTLVTKTHLAAEFLDAGEHWVAQAVLEEVLRASKRVRASGGHSSPGPADAVVTTGRGEEVGR